jgi:hypothetical protein
MRRTRLTVMSVAFIVFATAFAAPLYAQHHETLSVGEKGMVKFSSKVKAGDVVLEPGMYHVQHVIEGSDHVIVFKPVSMPAGYREGQMNEGREAVRVKCQIEPVAKSVSNTKIQLSRNASGERVIESIQIAGEKARHTF